MVSRFLLFNNDDKKYNLRNNELSVYNGIVPFKQATRNLQCVDILRTLEPLKIFILYT
jgi:hypothetical protein